MNDLTFDTIRSCRSCGYEDLVGILDLGEQPLANALVKKHGGIVRRFPLSTAFCPRCSLFQLKETVSKEILFDDYIWITGTAKGTHEYVDIFVRKVIERTGLQEGDLVLEIASNDGTVLRQFLLQKMEVLGVEPAKNISEIAQNQGVRTETAYWGLDTARNIVSRYGHPAVVIARNVIPHVSELHSVIEGIAHALGEDGTGVIEFHSGAIIADMLHYDSIYHEHLCYFTAHSLTRLLEQHGLCCWGAEESPISGGSIVLYFSRMKHDPDAEYQTLIQREKNSEINSREAWEKFGAEARIHREKTMKLLESLSGRRIVGFGASARSATFMNFCGIGNNYLKAIIDNNPMKQGYLTPAGDVPIVSFDDGFALKPEIIFLLAWNFKDEIIGQCKKQGFVGEYIVPFPKNPHMIPGE